MLGVSSIRLKGREGTRGKDGKEGEDGGKEMCSSLHALCNEGGIMADWKDGILGRAIPFFPCVAD